MDFTIAGPPGAPTDVGLDAGGVSEGKPAGMRVGRLVASDPNPLDTFTWQLVAGTGATHNASFTIAGDEVLTAAVLNRAVTPSVSLRVRTTDSSGATFEKAIVLAVMGPPAITRQPDPVQVFAGDPVVFDSFPSCTWKRTFPRSCASSSISRRPARCRRVVPALRSQLSLQHARV